MKITKEDNTELFIMAYETFIENQTDDQYVEFSEKIYRKILELSNETAANLNRSMGKASSNITIQFNGYRGMYKNRLASKETILKNIVHITNHFREITKVGYESLKYQAFGEYRNLEVPQQLIEPVVIELNKENIKNRLAYEKKLRGSRGAEKSRVATTPNTLSVNKAPYRFTNKNTGLSIKVEGIPDDLLTFFKELVVALDLEVEVEEIKEVLMNFDDLVHEQK